MYERECKVTLRVINIIIVKLIQISIISVDLLRNIEISTLDSIVPA